MLYLIASHLLVDYDGDHRLKNLFVEELPIKFTVNYIEFECWPLHYRDSVYLEPWVSFFELAQFALNFKDLLIHARNILGQKFNIVFTIFECLELQIYEFLNVDVTILVSVHL